MTHYLVTRQIGIDAGHRIRTHGSKCRHIHGHRYTIEATCRARSGTLHQDGEQAGMVLDFGFLKDEMLAVIDAACDHGFIAELADAAILDMFCPEGVEPTAWRTALGLAVARDGYCLTTDTRLGSKLYVVPFTPTAECLARHWFERLTPRVAERSDGIAALARVRVWETPNCWAEYGD